MTNQEYDRILDVLEEHGFLGGGYVWLRAGIRACGTVTEASDFCYGEGFCALAELIEQAFA